MKALVIHTPTQNYEVNDVVMILEDSVADRYTHWLLNFAEFRDIPAELEGIGQQYLMGADLPPVWSREGFPDLNEEPTFLVDTWTRDGESDETTEPIFSEDTWIKEGEADVTVDPEDETYLFMAENSADLRYSLQTQGAVDTRYTFISGPQKIVTTKPDYVVVEKTNRITEKYNEMNTDVLAGMAAVFGTTQPESATAYKETWTQMIASPSDFSGAGLTSRFDVAGLSIGDALDTDQKVTDYATAKTTEVNAYGVTRMQRIEQFRTERAAILAE